MDKTITFTLILIVITGVAYYFWQEHQAALILAEQNSQEQAPLRQVVEEPAEPEEIRFPVPERIPLVPVLDKGGDETGAEVVAEAFVLPALDESDELMHNIFTGLYNAERLAGIFVFREFVRHVVVTIDNLTAIKLPRRFIFTKSPAEKFVAIQSEVDNEYIMDSSNSERYRPFIDFADKVSNRDIVSVYVRYYPLFQQAYEELGYPGRYFNDRLIDVIDHLLQTPEVSEPIKLLRPKVYYQFADPELEKMSAGQKILVRVGRQNRQKIKPRLKELRRILTSLEPGTP